MVPFVAPGTASPLQRRGEAYVSGAGETFPIVEGIPRFVESEGYADHFGLQWRRHARTQLDSETGLPISRTRLERCLGAAVGSLRGQAVLEAGCGAGRFTELLVEAGAEVHSVDLSRAVEANLANVGVRPNYVVAQADLLRLPFPPASFDLVLCLGVVQHTPSPEETIRHLFAMVRPGGTLVFDHYRRLRQWTRPLLPLYRTVLKRMSAQRANRWTEAAARRLFPLHWALRERPVAQAVLNRVSPCVFYYHLWPEMSRERHLAFSVLDTHDTLTDWYKHRRSPEEIRGVLEALGATDIHVQPGGNGVEARCRKTGAAGGEP